MIDSLELILNEACNQLIILGHQEGSSSPFSSTEVLDVNAKKGRAVRSEEVLETLWTWTARVLEPFNNRF
jgi:hypothetical protein